MPYDDLPEVAPTPLPRPDEYNWKVDLTGTMTVPGPDEDSPPVLMRRSTIDDLDLFSPETKTSNKQMMDFLDRVIADVTVRGRSLGPKVRGHSIPHECFSRMMEDVGGKIKELYNPGN
jgi:hypothetical protein